MRAPPPHRYEGTPPEQLTALGHHLAALPVDVRIGKLIILGTLLQCTEQALTLAAALSMRSPFVAPYGRRNEADESKANWAVGMSDHMAILKVYEAYDAVIGGDRKRVAFCQENMLSFKGMQTLYQTRRELLEHLWEIGFVRKGSSGKQADKEQQSQQQSSSSSSSSTSSATADVELLKALLVGAMWPKVAKVEAPPEKGGKGGGKGRGKGGKGGGKGGGGGRGGGGGGGDKTIDPADVKIKVKDDTGVCSATLHPSCVAAQPSSKGIKPGFLVYGELVKTSALFIRDLTLVPPVALMLFGGRLSLDEKASLVLIDDGWVRFKVRHDVAMLILQIRAGLEATLRRKIEKPNDDFSKEGWQLVDGVVKLIASEGGSSGKVEPAAPVAPAVQMIAYSALY